VLQKKLVRGASIEVDHNVLDHGKLPNGAEDAAAVPISTPAIDPTRLARSMTFCNAPAA
jgi:hypothetical protein